MKLAKIKWRRVFHGCWHAFIGDDLNPSAEVEKNYYGRKLWAAYVGGRKLVDGNSDCFSFAIAKRVVEDELNKQRSK